jgi:hypothetical protein
LTAAMPRLTQLIGTNRVAARFRNHRENALTHI